MKFLLFLLFVVIGVAGFIVATKSTSMYRYEGSLIFDSEQSYTAFAEIVTSQNGSVEITASDTDVWPRSMSLSVESPKRIGMLQDGYHGVLFGGDKVTRESVEWKSGGIALATVILSFSLLWMFLMDLNDAS
jgi:succinate-acetate transporter protein